MRKFALQISAKTMLKIQAGPQERGREAGAFTQFPLKPLPPFSKFLLIF